MTPRRCQARVVGDQLICARCALQWDRSDPDRPECRERPAEKPWLQQKKPRGGPGQGGGGHETKPAA